MSPRQLLAAAVSLGLMALFGLGVYAALGTLQTKTTTAVVPTQEQALVDLPGTIFLAQGGSIYSLHNLTFTKLNAPAGNWVQVAPAPNGDVIGVDKGNGYSNVYLLSPTGRVLRTLLSDSSSSYFNNHFAYYPRVSPNGQSLFYSWNWIDPYANYNVDFDATQAWPGYDWMGVSKAALESVVRYLAQYLGARKIRVNAVSAGPTYTTAAKGIPGFSRFPEVFAQQAPLGWDPRDSGPVGKAVVALLSDYFPATTGELIHVDGGFHAVGASARGPEEPA